MKRDKFIIGTRGSKLALIYTEKVTKFLKKVSSTHLEIKQIVTSGDENQNDRLSNITSSIPEGILAAGVPPELKDQLDASDQFPDPPIQ